MVSRNGEIHLFEEMGSEFKGEEEDSEWEEEEEDMGVNDTVSEGNAVGNVNESGMWYLFKKESPLGPFLLRRKRCSEPVIFLFL